MPSDWSRDRRFILFTRAFGPSNSDLFAYSVDRKIAEPILQTSFLESTARLSNDGRWLAYFSNESGENEVYLRRFTVAADGKPSLGTKRRVSTSGGSVPH